MSCLSVFEVWSWPHRQDTQRQVVQPLRHNQPKKSPSWSAWLRSRSKFWRSNWWHLHAARSSNAMKHRKHQRKGNSKPQRITWDSTCLWKGPWPGKYSQNTIKYRPKYNSVLTPSFLIQSKVTLPRVEFVNACWRTCKIHTDYILHNCIFAFKVLYNNVSMVTNHNFDMYSHNTPSVKERSISLFRIHETTQLIFTFSVSNGWPTSKPAQPEKPTTFSLKQSNVFKYISDLIRYFTWITTIESNTVNAGNLNDYWITICNWITNSQYDYIIIQSITKITFEYIILHSITSHNIQLHLITFNYIS